jgi:hypothetical protein
MNASAKIVVLKLKHPITSFPAFKAKIEKLNHVALSEFVYIVRTRTAAPELCDEFSAIFYDQGSVFVSCLCPPCRGHGVYPEAQKAMGLVNPPEAGQCES